MGIKIARKKPGNMLLSVIYRLSMIPVLSKKRKLKLFLNLEWVFDRLAHEYSHKYYSVDTHPCRITSLKFILDNVKGSDTVLDLGSNLGDMSFKIAEKAKLVVGIDHNKVAVEHARNKYTKDNLEFHVANAYTFITEHEKPFDVLILSHIIEHLDDPKDFLMKFKNHFRNIYIEVPDFDRYYLNHYRKDLQMSLIYSDDDHVSEFDRYELGQILNDCNIEIIKSEYILGVQKLWCAVRK